ncbi:hypothetical protein ACEPAH_7221 [Sanghuangporus vaninii]
MSSFYVTSLSSFRARSEPDPIDSSLVKLFVSVTMTGKYFAVALLAVLVYHSFLTLDKEIKYFWSDLRSSASMTYFACSSYGSSVRKSQLNILIAAESFGQTLLSCTCCCLVSLAYDTTTVFWLRSGTLLDKYTKHLDKKLFMWLLLLLGLDGSIGLAVLIYGNICEGIGVGSLPNGMTVCGLTRASPQALSIFSWTIPMAYGLILLVLALYKATEYWRLSSGFKGLHLVRVLIQDQVIYFGLKFRAMFSDIDSNAILSSDAFLSFILIFVLSMLGLRLFPFSFSSLSSIRKSTLLDIWRELVSPSSKSSLERAISAFSNYGHLSMGELSQMRKTYSRVSRVHKRIGYELGYPDKLERLAQAIRQNSVIARSIADFAAAEIDLDLSFLETDGAGSSELREVREAFLHFARDWCEEGKEEREAAMKPILQALKQIAPESVRRKNMKVLVPGCGLGRLAWEISQLGFTTHANELSHYMNLSFRFLLSPSHTPQINHHAIQPYAHWFSHQRSNKNLFRSLTFPDVLPRLSSRFHHIPGDFLRLKPITESELFDVVVTQFFIDTSYNIISTISQIHSLLKPGGTWINLGPLLWRSGAQAALELSLDELLLLAEKIGFDFTELENEGDGDGDDRSGGKTRTKTRTIECEYTADKEAMMRWVYKAEFWLAKKR